MFFVLKIDEENGQSVVKSVGGKTQAQCLKNALKEHLITRVEKESYEHGVPCLTVIEADDHQKAIELLQSRFNEKYGKYVSVEIKND